MSNKGPMPDRVLRFDSGTLLLEHFPADDVPEGFVHDHRVGLPRAKAIHYHAVVLDLYRRKIPYDDRARAYGNLDRPFFSERTPRAYQEEAVGAWKANGRRGVVVLPTGSGKSFVAELCIADANRATLVVAPTIDLVGQWYDTLLRAFGGPIGVLGGGVHELHDIMIGKSNLAW